MQRIRNNVKYQQILQLMTKCFVLVIFCGSMTFVLIIFVVLRLQMDLPTELHVLLFVSGSLDEFFSMFAVWSQFGSFGDNMYLKMFGWCHHKVVAKWETKFEKIAKENAQTNVNMNQLTCSCEPETVANESS